MTREKSITIDCRGLACPEPVLRARQALTAKVQRTVEVLVDARVAQENVTRLGNSLGYAVEVIEQDAVTRLRISKEDY